MMTYLDSEKSNYDAHPNELYKFAGSFQSFYYTSGPIPITFDGNVYQPATLQRSDIAAGTQSDDGLSISIDLPVDTDVVQQYAFQIAPPTLKLTIYRYHDIAEWIAVWQGFVGQIRVTDGKATLRSPSVLEYVLNGTIPTVFYQTICNHVLFDERCKVSELLWSQAATITIISGRTLTVSTIGTLNGQLVGGSLRLANGEERMIVSQAANVIVVNYPFSSAVAAGAITLVAGCDHDAECVSKFANGINYGGFRYIPPENVFSSGIEPGKVAISDDSCLPFIPEFEGWYLMFRGFIYAPAPPLASNSLGTTLLTFGGAADFNTQSCKPFGSVGELSRCDYNDATGTWREYRYDYDVLAAISGSSIHLQHQYFINTHETNARLKLQYRRWFDSGWTTIMGATGDGVDATTDLDGSVDLDDLFPRDNYWTVPF